MKLLATCFLCALFSISGTARASCDDAANQPGMFPFEDERAVAAFVTKFQAAVLKPDKKAVAEILRFPLRVRIKGKQVAIRRANFLSHFYDVFTPAVRGAVREAKFRSQRNYTCVFWNSHGLMFGNGEVWIGATGGGRIRVIAINN